MGAGACAGLAAATRALSAEDLQSVVGSLKEDQRNRLKQALGATSAVAKPPNVSPTFLLESGSPADAGKEEGIPILKAGDIKKGAQGKPFRMQNGFGSPWFGPMKFSIHEESWTLDAFLGGGAFGQAYMATHCASGQRYILKFLEKMPGKCMEIEFLKQIPRALIKHPNIVTYAALALDIGSGWGKAQHIVFMEVVPNGELFDFLIDGGGLPVSEGTMRRFVRDVISGLAECVKCGISHRDLKPENLLIDENGRIVVIDLGNAKLIAEAEAAESSEPEVSDAVAVSAFMRVQTQGVGTPFYQAPEIHAKRLSPLNKYDSERADVFAVGTIAFMLHRPTFPFQHPRAVGKFEDLSGSDNAAFWQKCQKFDSATCPSFPKAMTDFLNSLWRKNPDERPTFEILKRAIAEDEEVLNNFPGLRWLAGPISDPLEFVRELRRRRPSLMLKSSNVVESLALFVRAHGNDSAAAFHVADANNDGKVNLPELKAALWTINEDCTDVSVADLIHRYMKANETDMSLPQFEQMAKEWEFGGRPIIWGVGEFMVRRFAFSCKTLPLYQKELDEFVRITTEGLQKESYVVDAAESEAPAALSVTMSTAEPRREVCVLRLDFLMVEEKIVIEGRRTWGSAIDELQIERHMNDHLVITWGPRIDCPVIPN